MKLAGIIIFLFVSLNLSAQDHILKKKNKIEKKLDKHFTEQNRSYSKEIFPGILMYVINDSLSLPFSLMLYFDKTGLCIAEERIFNCDSCLKQDLAFMLARSYPKWHRTEGGHYKSKFPSSTYMETVVSPDLFVLRFTYKGWKGGKYENFVVSFVK